MIIAVDFDGTVVTYEYPKIGDSIGAEPVLKKLVEAGHKLILLTMRSGDTLAEAVKWFEQKGIPLYGVNYNPTQSEWTSSNKCYAQLYIDDAALGCPVIASEYYHRVFVDWGKVEELLKMRRLI